MRRLTLTRYETGDAGTFGTLEGGGVYLDTVELPWRENARGVSCIPCGLYTCRPYSSAKFKDVYEVCDVPDRSAILIHVGNWAGDVAKGLRSDVRGCILVGMSRGQAKGQEAVLMSKQALKELRLEMGQTPFELLILNNTDVEMWD